MTIEQALAWINGDWRSSPYAKQEVAGFGIDVDGAVGFQCVDFSTAYSIFLDTPFNSDRVLNAITLWQNDQPGWTRVSEPQPGDVFVRNATFQGVNYGDTGIVVAIGNGGVNVIQQNLKADLYHGSPPAPFFWSFGQLLGYLRCNNIKEADVPTLTTPGNLEDLSIGMLGRTSVGDPNLNNLLGQDLEETIRYFLKLPEHLALLDRAAASEFVPVTEQLFKKKG